MVKEMAIPSTNDNAKSRNYVPTLQNTDTVALGETKEVPFCKDDIAKYL
jgi:hypothetical protein